MCKKAEETVDHLLSLFCNQKRVSSYRFWWLNTRRVGGGLGSRVYWFTTLVSYATGIRLVFFFIFLINANIQVLEKDMINLIFALNWSKYTKFLTISRGLWTIFHHHLAIAFLFLVAGVMYLTNWVCSWYKRYFSLLDAYEGSFTDQLH